MKRSKFKLYLSALILFALFLIYSGCRQSRELKAMQKQLEIDQERIIKNWDSINSQTKIY